MIFFLKRIFEKTEELLLDIYNTVISIVKLLLLSKFGIKYPKATSENCIILGNGPSLKTSFEENFDFFKKHQLFCVNHFAQSKEYDELKPQNYVFLDPNFFSEYGMKRDPNVAGTIKKLSTETNWDMNLFIPYISRNSKIIQQLIIQNPKIKLIYYNYTIVKGFKSVVFYLFRKNLGMPLCQNVLGACIYLSLNGGYKKVYLFGAEHSWIQNLRVSEDNHLYMNHVHFYSNEAKPMVTKIYKSQESEEKMPISEYFYACFKTFNVYYILEAYSKKIGARVFNCTNDSYIDAFEKKTFDKNFNG